MYVSHYNVVLLSGGLSANYGTRYTMNLHPFVCGSFQVRVWCDGAAAPADSRHRAIGQRGQDPQDRDPLEHTHAGQRAGSSCSIEPSCPVVSAMAPLQKRLQKHDE